MTTRPRRGSMTDAFRIRQALMGIAIDDMPPFLQSLANSSLSGRARIEEFVAGLPKLTEQDLIAQQLTDSTCPICITGLMAIIAEEEMAIAMDSPAHAIEELGVTKLTTCGHVYCKKDIQNWVRSGRNSCPTCRRPMIDNLPDAPAEIPAGMPLTLPAPMEIGFYAEDIDIIQPASLPTNRPVDSRSTSLGPSGPTRRGSEDSHRADDGDRDYSDGGYSSMFS